MPKPRLLCITPHPGGVRNYGRIPRELVPRWVDSQAFDQIDVWAAEPGPPVEGWATKVWTSEKSLDERVRELAEGLQNGAWTHIWICLSAEQCLQLASKGLVAEALPDTVLLGYPWFSTPFLDPKLGQIVGQFDVLAVFAHSIRQQLRPLGLRVRPFTKQRLARSQFMHVLPPGVDTDVFRPSKPYEPSDRLRLHVNGPKRPGKGLVTALRVVRELRLLGVPATLHVHAVARHLPHQPYALQQFCEGHALDFGVDVTCSDDRMFTEQGNPLVDDQTLAELYAQADIILVPNVIDGWSFTLLEAMACGIPVAAPDDHVYAEHLSTERAIPLTVGDFDYASTGTTFVSHVIPSLAARMIAQQLPNLRSIGQAGRAYATHLPSWDAQAQLWLEWMGVI